ncbi:hypothetical protein C8J57DRAFT_1302106 [Mycena rebaudengoi]|nr:hypothetical protein C8J57DRAFT_1302106 [Mycena rebaudengoi]
MGLDYATGYSGVLSPWTVTLLLLLQICESLQADVNVRPNLNHRTSRSRIPVSHPLNPCSTSLRVVLTSNSEHNLAFLRESSWRHPSTNNQVVLISALYRIQ